MNPIIQEDLAYITQLPLPWSNLAHKTVLVSGANGFLPAYMVETFLFLNQTMDLKIKILALVRNLGKAQKRFSHYLVSKELNFLVQDVCNPLNYPEKIDYIIHAASQASPKYYGQDPVGTLLANVQGTYNLLTVAEQNKVEGFLFFSSSEVYGQVPSDHTLIKEEDYGYLDPTKVRSCYAESKRMGENMCISWLHQKGVPTMIVRPFHTYGPGMSLEDGRVFADFVADLIHNRDIIMKSDGKAQRAFCYLADAIQGYFTVLLKGLPGQAYNIGNPSCETSILSLAKQLIALFPEKQLKLIEMEARNSNYLKSQVSRVSPDISKAISLGWKPQTSITVGFKRTVASFLE
ncbi:NAD-dependent epimerase/dehydratase family protein [Anthocerotibacter panamensis]|uniref:NAD-dependent epimerase/dehydratase family protein n=1 Tax=Anthocerotibacter panamensis TaxID=2857077 RepID=UPI001C408C62|nr:NAD-dependent epimerase/dehydratase family protein [Anthocerotibacter panamensis]